MVPGGGIKRLGGCIQRLPQVLNERQEGGAVEGEGGAAAGVRVDGVWEGGELGAGEVVAVHGDEGGGGGGGESVEPFGDDGREGGFAGAGDA